MVIRNYADVKVHIKTEDILKENVIYRFTFPNGKFYIGQTVQKLNVRLSKHCNNSFSIKDSEFNTIKSRAIRKYMQFEVDVLYQGDNLDEEEIKFIEMHQSTNPEYGYNSSLGGKGCYGRKMSEANKKALINALSKPCSEERKKRISDASTSKKRVLQYNSDGKLLKEWSSAREASSYLKLNKAAVSNAIRNNYKAGGFIWKYKEN